MRSNPYFERLGEAYAAVDGIPDHQITLDIEQVSIAEDMSSIGVKDSRYIEPTNWDAMVLTPDMWLSLCPPYIDIVWPLIENWGPYGVEVFWRVEDRVTSRFEVSMAHLFNLTYETAEELFGMRGDDEMDDRTDKQVFLDRITAFLRDNDQEVTVGLGHVEQDEMLEHGISLSESTTDSPADTVDTEVDLPTEEHKANRPPVIHTGFAALALESDTPGAETFDTEASATAVSPITHEQSVEQKEEK